MGPCRKIAPVFERLSRADRRDQRRSDQRADSGDRRQQLRIRVFSQEGDELRVEGADAPIQRKRRFRLMEMMGSATS